MKIGAVATLVIAAATLVFASSPARAEGDIYSRLTSMREMDANKDGMLSKDEFIQMVFRLWDMKADEMKARSGLPTSSQLKELQKVLGRTIQ